MVRSWAAGSGAIGAMEPLAAVGRLVAERGDPAVGRRTVARAEHPDVVARRAAAPGQAQHLPLHATGDGEAVGADDPDAHAARRLVAGVARASRPSQLAARRGESLGQLGCRRCHCSGAWRIRRSSSWARSWVMRATSSRSLPWRSTGSGGRDDALVGAAR